MLLPRIIPCLLIKNGGLVKTVNFKNPRYLGDPINAVRIFNEKEVDELVVLDIDATLNGREPDYRMIEHLAAECRMPLCYGGGVTTSDQVRRIVQLGVEKVAISAAAIQNPLLVKNAAQQVGNQSVVAVLDVRLGNRSRYEVWTHNGDRNTGKSPVDLARLFENMGAGEVLINSIDGDGAMKGYDLILAEKIRASINVPMTILGGAGSLHDIGMLFSKYDGIGAAAGSLFVFKGSYRAVLINYPNRSEKDKLIDTYRYGSGPTAQQLEVR